jgi:hypothetical protein
MTKPTALEAAYQEQKRWSREKHAIYLKLFSWYGPAVSQACPDVAVPPWCEKSEAMRQVRLRAHEEWEAVTGLRQLDSSDSGRWYAAAIVARKEQGLPVENVRSLTPKQLAEIILPWAQARAAAITEPETRWSKADNPEAWAGLYGVSVRTFTRWIKADPPRLRTKVIDSKNIMVDLRDMPTRNR